jgi:hypothetical protein
MLTTGDPNKVIIVEKDGLCIIDQKTKSIEKCKRPDISVLLPEASGA